MRASYSLDVVTRIYEAALARRGADSLIANEEPDFEILVRAAAVRLEQAGSATDDPDRYSILHSLDSAEFADSHRTAERLFARLGLTVPVPQAFADAGVNWLALAVAYRRLEARGADPHLLITPLLPLTSSGEASGQSWQNLYAQLTADAEIPNNPLRARADGHGLQLGAGVGTSDAVDELALQERQSMTSAARHHVEDELGAIWTVAVIALAETASQGNITYSAVEADHLSPSEYLALQAQRILTGLPPIDRYSWTWLRGTLDTDAGPHAAAGVWVAGYGQIRIYANPVGYAQERLLARPPLRG